MKYLFFLLAFIFSGSVYAQDCSSYYFLQEGKKLEMTIYNKRGKTQGKQTIHVKELNKSGDSFTSNVEIQLYDEKDKPINSSEVAFQCKNGVFMMNMKLNMPSSAQSGNITASTEEFYMEYPSSMNAGDVLRDGVMEMDIEANNMKQHIKVLTSNRKVEGKETITTPAGSWDAYKISYTSKVEITTMGIKIPANVEGVEYFVPGFGVVKTENKQGYTLLTAIN